MDFARWIPTPPTYLPYSLVEGGIRQGGLVEVSGPAGGGKIEAVLRFLAENPELQAAWIEEGNTLYPCAFPQQGVGLERVLFVNAEPVSGMAQGSSLLMDCAHQILKSGIFGAVILIPRDSVHEGFFPTTLRPAGRPNAIAESFTGAPREVELRRLQISAEKAGATVFILREKPSTAYTWPLTAQLFVSRDGLRDSNRASEIRIEIFKNREQGVFKNASCMSLSGNLSS